MSQLSLTHLRCLFLSCRATANVQNVLQRQSGLKTERDGKRIDTPLAAATALGGCELYSYPASGEMKRELGGGVEGGYKDGQAVSGDERRPGHLPSDVGGESLSGKKATGNWLRVTGRRRWRQVMG